jgi:uncharacterized membrane protein
LLSIIEFFGRFHPLLVHLPIGILLVALLLQWLARKPRFIALRPSVSIVLLCGVISAAASCITGYLLSISDDYDEVLASWHMWMALALLFVSFLLYLKEINTNFRVSRALLSIGLLLLIAITGHLGGSLTHGSDYLSTPFKALFSGDSLSVTTIKPVPNVQEALVYQNVVQPILQTRCLGCHNSSKQKGGLRMDEISGLVKGGKNGKVFQPGNAGASEMVRRLLLPVTDDDHMPPPEKPQPTENQLTLLQWWINTGASFTKKVKELDQPEKVKPIIFALQQPLVSARKPRTDIPLDAVEMAEEKALAGLRSHNINVVPVAQSSNYLAVNFATNPAPATSDIKLLQQLKKQLIWLKLDNTNIDDKSLAEISPLNALTRLSLSNTAVTDNGLAAIARLENLQYLNLAGTNITAAGLQQLIGLKKIRNIFLFRTGFRSADYALVKQIWPAAAIDTGGYQLEKLASDTTVVKAPE